MSDKRRINWWKVTKAILKALLPVAIGIMGGAYAAHM